VTSADAKLQAGSMPSAADRKAQIQRVRRLRTEANGIMLGVVILLMWVPPLSLFLGLDAGSLDATIANTFERIACMVATWFAVYRIFQYHKEIGQPSSSSFLSLETLFALILTALLIKSVLAP
jgi:hypothetical protein